MEWYSGLDVEDKVFVKNFVLASGSLKEMAKLYQVSYPTIRVRLNKIIEKIKVIDENDSSYVRLIKKLAIEDKYDVHTAKILIDEYRKEEASA